MTDYDLLILSPVEFENISKDLLEKKLNVELEVFGSGKDGGIDLRFSRDKQNSLVVQCKRYKSFTSLYSNLKKEVKKVQAFGPKRYVLTTTVSLNQAQKTKIGNLFGSYIKNFGDIYGKEQLNSLIAKYPDIEKTHYKLWLSSTAVLSSLLHSKVVNQTEFELENIKDNLKTYAENESFREALKLLLENHFVIISGLPGIGKTTLARILVYRLIGGKEFDQFIYLSGSIDEAYDIYDKNKKQLFLFDDFLGTNYLAQKIGRNEDNRLLEFIKKVRRSKNTALIMTTREYILKQAQSDYRLFEDKDFEDGKYIIDLSKYTKLVKAQILYNHLFAADFPEDYLNIFLDKKVYAILIGHKKYNPRLIETILREKPWESFSSGGFPVAIVDYFDNPNSIWENIFKNEISENAQSVLRVLLTTTAPIRLNDLIEAVQAYVLQNNASISRTKIEKALKELDGTFIMTSHDPKKGGDIIVEYQNPAIYDFLRDYYGHDRRSDLMKVVESSVFLNQLTEIFTTELGVVNFPGIIKGKIILTDDIKFAIATKLLRDFDTLKWSAHIGNNLVGFSSVMYDEPSQISKIYKILFDTGLRDFEQVEAFMLKKYKEALSGHIAGSDLLHQSLELLEHFSDELSEEEAEVAVAHTAHRIVALSDLEEFDSYANDYQFAHDKVALDPEFVEMAEEALENEVPDLDDDHLENYIDTIWVIAAKYGLDITRAQEAVHERLRNGEISDPSRFYQEEIDDLVHEWTPARPSIGAGGRTSNNTRHIPSDDEVIDRMFESLK